MNLTLNDQPITEKRIDYSYIRFPLPKLSNNPWFVSKYTGKVSPNKKYLFDTTILKPGVIYTSPGKEEKYKSIRII